MTNQSDEPATKKSLGQHWLHDETSLLAMCQAAAVQPTDTILEIGPGLGTLTTFLVQQAKQVIAIELDKILAANLGQRVPASNLEVISQDILTFDFTSLAPGYKVVANIPYYLTGNLLRTLSETLNPPTAAILLTQKEVAERVAASPGSMSLLSVTVQFYWEVSLGQEVPAELFTPPPKVDSQILILKRRQKKLFTDVEPKGFFRIVKAGFAQRRKTLLNTLSSNLQLDRTSVALACQSVNIDPNRRAQTLNLEDWYNLYISLNT
jgi:16S rRNA (adenine1518-N6/adenine1519-N6)-dimethyltransferase